MNIISERTFKQQWQQQRKQKKYNNNINRQKKTQKYVIYISISAMNETKHKK